jgi:integrase
MVQVQRLIGCRPCEVTIMRPMDLDRAGDVWTYRPQSHKTEHHNKTRAIPVGPRAQALLLPLLEVTPPDGYLFSPKQALAELRARQRATRRSKVQPSQVNRAKRDPQKQPGGRYRVDSYGQSVRKACAKAGVNPWHPNRLRHARATEIGQQFGIEAVRTTLGHSSPDTSAIYAARDMGLASRVALATG